MNDDARLWAKIDRRGEAECWPWIGKSRTTFGYGVVRYHGRSEGAHRAAWMSWHGPIPDGMHMLHSCDNPGCCNPHHLRPGTPKENIRDAVERKRLWMCKVTHCPKGHAYDTENTAISKAGKRNCRQCFRDRVRARYANPEWAEARNARARMLYQMKNPNAKPRTRRKRPAAASGTASD